jgi:hypothetical protein
MSPDDELEKAAKTFRERRPIYKDNYLRVGKALDALFPEGVVLKTEHDHIRYHLFSWIVGKLSRYAVQWNNGGHPDSAHDLVVYAAMLASYKEEKGKPVHVDWGYKSQPDLEARGG